MATSYGQYCPLALAVELLCRRWTLLVLSRLLDGCTTFSDIRRGVPKISPSLLSQRLDELEQAGLVERLPGKPGRSRGYRLTAAGRDLDGLVDGLAVWGQRWARDMCLDDLDPAFLAWSMQQRLNLEALPEGRLVVEFEFSGTPDSLSRFWLVSRDRDVDMCLTDPGLDSDLLVRADIRVFVEAWRGFRDLRNEIRQRRIRLYGPAGLKSAFPEWLLLSALAVYPRATAGKERALTRRRAGTHSRRGP